MAKSDRSQPEQITFEPLALQILKYLTVACPISDKKNYLKFFNNPQATLRDIQSTSLPTTGIDLLTTLWDSDRDRQTITTTDIIKVFAGTKHQEGTEQRAGGKGIVASTGQSYQERLAELGINLDSPENKATFALIDLAVLAKVAKIENGSRDRLRVRAVKEKVTFTNIAIPQDQTRPTENDLIIIHYGVLAGIWDDRLNNDQTREIFDQQAGNQFFAEQLGILSGATIDCQKICPPPGFNLTKWAEERL
jgi:hypothetical protein